MLTGNGGFTQTFFIYFILLNLLPPSSHLRNPVLIIITLYYVYISIFFVTDITFYYLLFTYFFLSFKVCIYCVNVLLFF